MDDLEEALKAAHAGERDYVLAIFDLDGFKAYNDTLRPRRRRPPAAPNGRRARRGRRRASGAAYRLGGDEFCVLAPIGAGKAVVAARRLARGAQRGRRGLLDHRVAGRRARSRPRPTPPRRPCGSPTAGSTRRRAARRARSGSRPATCCSASCASASPSSRRTWRASATLATELARRRGLTGEERELVGRAAELHDIGKMAIPDEILSKPGPAQRRGVGADAHPHPGRRAHARRVAGAAPGGEAGSLQPRALGWQRLSRRACRRPRSRSARGSSRSATPSRR